MNCVPLIQHRIDKWRKTALHLINLFVSADFCSSSLSSFSMSGSMSRPRWRYSVAAHWQAALVTWGPRIVTRILADASVIQWGQIKTHKLYLSVIPPPKFCINNTDATPIIVFFAPKMCVNNNDCNILAWERRFRTWASRRFRTFTSSPSRTCTQAKDDKREREDKFSFLLNYGESAD